MNNNIVVFSADTTVEGNTLSGMAHIFGAKARIGNFIETFSVGAFSAALKKSDMRAFYQHDPKMLLGRQSSGTLRVMETDEGLAYSIDLPDTSYAKDLRNLVARGDLREMSFGFIPGKYEIRRDGGIHVRQHVQVRDLIEISPVSLPAFEGTSISLRNDDGYEDIRSQLIFIRARMLTT